MRRLHHPHPLASPKVNHLHSNAPALTGLEGEGDSAAYPLEGFGVNLHLKRPLEFLPSVGVLHVGRHAVGKFYLGEIVAQPPAEPLRISTA